MSYVNVFLCAIGTLNLVLLISMEISLDEVKKDLETIKKATKEP